ncbi:hypothetical protein HMPREF9413_1255 [Paenibacillus sp. HGF7]|nr:hypothetical protein HMPREF9413_1255 [Paenibacillus sp. HGF7]
MTDIRADAEIISFSTYLGDTRWRHDKPSDQVITTGIKKKSVHWLDEGSIRSCDEASYVV